MASEFCKLVRLVVHFIFTQFEIFLNEMILFKFYTRWEEYLIELKPIP